MKEFTKWLSLLLAGVLLFAALTACEDGSYQSDDDEDDEEQSESSSRYKNLTPEELGEALLEAENFTVEMLIAMEDSGGNSSSQLTYTYIKYGDIIKDIMKVTSAAYNEELEVYADLKNNLVYQQEDGQWTCESDETDLEEMLKEVLYSDLLLDSGNYLEYDSETDRYPLKEEALRDQLDVIEEATVEGYMSRKGSEYTFFFSVTAEDGGTQSCAITVKFTADRIELPEAQSVGNQGSALPDVGSPMPDIEE